MTKKDIIKREISYTSGSEENISLNGLVNFLCKHLDIKPEDLIDKD